MTEPTIDPTAESSAVLTADPFAAPADAELPYIPVAWRAAAVRADSLVIDVDENVKLHGDKDLAAQQDSLKSWGFTRQVIVRRANRQVIIGNGSVLAAMRNGWEYVPADFRDLTEDQARALGAADNMLGTLAEWNNEAIERLLADLPALELPDLTLDLGALGNDVLERLVVLEDEAAPTEQAAAPQQATPVPADAASAAEPVNPKSTEIHLERRVIVTLPDESTQIHFISEMINRGYPCRLSTVRAD